MSSKPKTAPADSRKIREYDSPPISKGQRSSLHMLGWKDIDIVEMTVPHALATLKARSAKPGSRAYAKQQQSQGLPAVPDHFTNEAIEERNANRLKPTPGLEVVGDEFTRKCVQAGTEEFQMDEYTGRVIKGADPLNAVLIEMQERFPDRRFRWMHEKEPLVAGPSWQNVYDGQGKQVTNGELFLQWMPEAIYDEGHRKPVQARSHQMTGQVTDNKSDDMRGSGDGPLSAPDEGKLNISRSDVLAA